MVKAYLRYELASAFGVVASGANILYDDTGKIIFAACLENVAMWSVKQASMVRQCGRESPDLPCTES